MKSKSIVCRIVCVVMVTVFLAGCERPANGVGEPGKDALDQRQRPFLTPVRARRPERGRIAAFFETTSRIEAEMRVEVLSKGSGQCLAVNVDVGDSVEKEEVLATLDREELEARLRQAQVSAQQQKAAYEVAQRSYEEGIGASIERDNARFAYEQAEASLELARIQLRYQTIRAPLDGVITVRMVQQGMVVSPGMPAFTIVSPDSYRLPINVPEKEVFRLAGGQEALVRIDAFPDREFTARVRRIDPSIDPMSGTVRVMLEFEEEDKRLLRESAFARVRLVMETRSDVLLAPREAVLEDGGRSYVYLLEEVAEPEPDAVVPSEDEPVYIARRREIRVGIEQSDKVEIREGLTEQDLVVVMGQYSLKPDAYVTITNIDDELAARSALTPETALKAAESDEAPAVSADRARRARIETQL